MDTYIILKVCVVTYIVIVALSDINRRVRLPYKKAIDVVLLSSSIIILLLDFHLGLLVTIAVMIYIIQTNQAVIEEAQERWIERFEPKRMQFYKPKAISACAPSDEYGNEKKQEASKDILNYTLDDKVKPYEIYLKMMTTQEHLDNASNSAFIDSLSHQSML
jgi:hypothetical protein